MSLTASDLVERLRVKYPAPEWCSFDELRERTGLHNARSIDFWAMHAWQSKRHRTVAVEVKISKADFRRELDKPQKREFWERTANEFWFCAPKGVIPIDELPEGCGLLETWGDGLRATRRAKQRMENEVDPLTWIAIVRRAAELQEASQREAEPFAEWRGRDITIDDLSRLAGKLYERSDWQRKHELDVRAAAMRRELALESRGHLPEWLPVFGAIKSAMQRMQSRPWDWEPTAEEAADWVRTLEAPANVRRLARQMRDLADQMDPQGAAEVSA